MVTDVRFGYQTESPEYDDWIVSLRNALPVPLGVYAIVQETKAASQLVGLTEPLSSRISGSRLVAVPEVWPGASESMKT